MPESMLPGRDEPKNHDMSSRIGHLVACKAAPVGYFVANRSGGVAVVFGLMAIVLFLAMGGAIDYSRWLDARAQSLAAIDAGVLAAGRALQMHPGDVPGAMASAQRFYQQNTVNRLPLASDSITFKTENNNTIVTAQGSAYIGTTLLQLAGINKLSLFDLSGSEFSKAVLAVGGNAGVNLEIAMMLDTSGSMSGQKIVDLKGAAKSLVDIVVWNDQSTYTSKVSLAPFSADVRLPDSFRDLARGANNPAFVEYAYACNGHGGGNGNGNGNNGNGNGNNGNGGGNANAPCTKKYYRTPCVVERKGSEKFTDMAPADGRYVMAEYNSSGTCSQSSDNAVVPLTSNKVLLDSKIDRLVIGGGTAGHTGTAWAWYTLSPNFNSIWPDAMNHSADYGADKLKKIAILMTDGEYNTEYNTDGVKVGSIGAGSAVNGSSVVQAKALCDGMKARGITVYTVGFDLGGNATAIDTLTYCATDPQKFYNATDGSQLRQAFLDIALRLSKLHLTQ